MKKNVLVFTLLSLFFSAEVVKAGAWGWVLYPAVWLAAIGVVDNCDIISDKIANFCKESNKYWQERQARLADEKARLAKEAEEKSAFENQLSQEKSQVAQLAAIIVAKKSDDEKKEAEK